MGQYEVTYTHTFILNILLTLCQVSLKKEQYLARNSSSICYLASWWQPAGVGEIEIGTRADSVYHIPPHGDRKVPDLSPGLYVCVCVLLPFSVI